MMKPVVVILILLCLMAVSNHHRHLNLALAVSTDELGDSTIACKVNESKDKASCGPTDGYVADVILHEDEFVRVWNMTLPPGATTSMHRHDLDYHFVVLQPTDIRVYGEDGQFLFDFTAAGTLGFTVQGEQLVPIGASLPHPIPRVHAAQNIGPTTFHEILVEHKQPLATSSSISIDSKSEL